MHWSSILSLLKNINCCIIIKYSNLYIHKKKKQYIYFWNVLCKLLGLFLSYLSYLSLIGYSMYLCLLLKPVKISPRKTTTSLQEVPHCYMLEYLRYFLLKNSKNYRIRGGILSGQSKQFNPKFPIMDIQSWISSDFWTFLQIDPSITP